MSQVIAACQPAQEIIVYCGGGKCDLSENAALMLRDNAGIPAAKLFVYTGGMTEWKDKSFPVETGDQNSGKLLNSNGR
jgi:3-mercaptopyruvate sulfurtransferase SseA